MRESESNQGGAPAEREAIARAHAIYTPLNLAFYDFVVHGLSNRIAWRCPPRRLHALYEANLTANHLEAGVGTGFLLDKGGGGKIGRLGLIDISRNCLTRAASRLARLQLEIYEANLLAPLQIDAAPFDSVGLTYVLHCLPGNMSEKLAAVDHLRGLMKDDAVLFGATILGQDISPNPAAKALLGLYNDRGVFNNRMDDLGSLEGGLKQRFGHVEVEQQGCVALFRAR